LRRRTKIILAAATGVLVLCTVGPFLIPVGKVPGTSAPEVLADPDGRFVELGGIKVHYKDFGEGAPPVILLHGFGASVFSWRLVMEPLAMDRKVVAFDRPGFGLTERPLPGGWEGPSPYGARAQATLTIALMDRLGIRQAVLVGHSAGGAVAALVAEEYPDRVRGLVLVAPAVYSSGPVSWVQPLLKVPQVRHLGPLLMRRLVGSLESILDRSWHDPALITTEVREGYRRPLKVDDWDRGLWELLLAERVTDLPARLGGIAAPTLVIAGDDDRIVPTGDSRKVAEAIPGAMFQEIPACGHLPQEEKPQEFLGLVLPFLQSLQD
jgi:pimeloyl-ACP methyl ester carboxylesterase